MLALAYLVVLGSVAAALLLAWLAFRRVQLPRPPIGVMTLGDVAFMLGAIVLVPYLYLALPLWLVSGLLALAALSVLTTLLGPVLRARWAVWLVTLVLLAADGAAALLAGTTSLLFFAINNLVLALVIVGITSLWAQSGLRARDLAVLAGALAGYDVVATSLLPLTTDLITRLAASPFAPILAWGVDDGHWLALGLGDGLLAAAGPLVLRKAFGRTAGLVALSLHLGVVALLLALPLLGPLTVTFPVMVVLGPLLVGQVVYWRRRCGPERTTWQYRQAEPVPGYGAAAI